METEQSGERAPSYNEARAEIEAVRAQISQMGANDSEFTNLNQVIKDLDDGGHYTH